MSKKDTAIKLRLDKRLSVKAIARELGCSTSSVSHWVRDYPLSDEEKKERMVLNGSKGGRKKREIPAPSRFYRLCDTSSLSSNEKGHIAECAVRFRLALLQVPSYQSSEGGSKYDFVIDTQSGMKKVQVRFMRRNSNSPMPYLSLHCSNGRKQSRRYRDDEFDFILGYDLLTDLVHVFSKDDVKNNTTIITATESSQEAWHKITGL